MSTFRPSRPSAVLFDQTLGALLLVLAAGSASAETIQITAHAGDTIEWVNNDFVAHTATARDGAWDVMPPPSRTSLSKPKNGARHESLNLLMPKGWARQHISNQEESYPY